MKTWRGLTPLDRLRSAYVIAPNGCWEWQRILNPGGYGQFHLDGQRMGAHRASYVLHIGPIPEGLDIDHLCRNRRCVNPAHLEPVTRSENLTRGGTGGWHVRTEHCPQGHPYDDTNTYFDKRGWRGCKTCRSEATRRFRARKRETAA